MPEQVVEPGVGWSYQQQFGSEKRPKSLVAQMHVPLGIPVAQLNELLDTIKTAIDRQIALYDLEEALYAIAEHRTKVAEMHTVVALAEESAKITFESSGRKGDWTPEKMTPHQQQERKQAQANLERWEIQYAAWQAKAEKLREIVNASISGSNSHAVRPEG